MPLVPVEIFYSCSDSPDDASLRQQLEQHLGVLRREGYISTWHKLQIVAGSDWQVELDRHLNTASLILLLISPDFLDSDYLYGVELQRAMERHDEYEARVIPILLRPCDWKGAPFEKLQMLPRSGNAITLWPDRDEAFTEIAREIRTVLQSLPSLPFCMPSPIRPLWNVPYQRNPYFTGRDELFTQLNQYLAPTEQTHGVESRRVALTQPHAIKGLGGIGKTQIAVEYAYRSRDLDHYTHTLWVNAASEETIIASFVSIANLLPSLAAQEEMDQRKIVEAVKRWLELCKQRWLLIFDNADEVTLVREYLPQTGNGSILLTTRAHAVGSLATSVEVETMGFLEGTLLLLRRAQRFEHASDEETNQAGNIVVALDHFPLALDQAGAYIEETECSFVDYLALYQTHSQALLAHRGPQATDYPHSVATTWLLSFQKIQEANHAAAELLHLCAFLAPDHIPEELLRDGAAYWPPLLQKAAADLFAFQQMIAELLKFSLVKRLTDDRMLSIHRLVQAVQMDMIEPGVRRQWAERVIRAVNDVFPNDLQDIAVWPQCLRYLDQVQTCNTFIEQYTLPLIEAADLLNRTGLYLDAHASYTIAEPLYQRALAIYEQQLGLEHPNTASGLNNLAELYRTQRKNAQAEPLYKRALQINEKQLGAHHPNTAMVLNNLALLYQNQEKYTQAEPLYKQALQIRESQLGAHHLETARSCNNLAYLYIDQGRYTQAEPLLLQALQIYEQQMAHHPDTAMCLNNLATLYMNQGKDVQAEPLLLQALQIYEQVAHHPDTAMCLNNLATLYINQGKDVQAEPLLLQALQIYEQQVGEHHFNTATSLNNLAALYMNQGKDAEAEPLFQRALAIYEYLGSEHPTYAACLLWLATLAERQQHTQDATRFYQQALAIYQHTLGAEHPTTQQVQRDYRSSLQAMNQDELMGEQNEEA